MDRLDIPIELHSFDPDVDNVGPRQKPDEPWEPGEMRRYLVQFRHSLFQQERQQVQGQFGLQLEAYIPQFAYVEFVDEQTVSDLRNHPLVNVLFPIEVEDKLSPDLGTLQFRDPARQNMTGFRLWALLYPEANLGEVKEKLEGIGATEIVEHDDREQGGVARIEFVVEDLDALREIVELESVNWIEDVPEAVSDGLIPGGLMWTGTDTVPAAAGPLRGTNQVVGILDKGMLNVNHCWFKDDNHAGHHPLHRKVLECHGTNKGNPPLHAVFVAGILCGADQANPGAALHGIASEAKIAYGNRENFKGDLTAATFYEYLDKLRTNQARVINCSWHSNGKPSYSQDSVDADRFSWRYETRLIVGAASNTGEVLGSPGSAKNSLCVAAAYVDGNGSCLGDSGTGAESGGLVEGDRRKPDLLAPGCDIESADTQSVCGTMTDSNLAQGETSPGNPQCAQGAYCAASYATPVASAAAVIVRQYFLEGWYPSGSAMPGDTHPPSGALLKAMLLNATEPTTGNDANYPTKNEGWGLLQLDRVLRLAGDAKKIDFWDVRNTNGLFRGGVGIHTVSVKPGASVLKATLVWTEPPGDLKSKSPVVNNLDLEVVSPTGVRYLGNWFDNGVSVFDNPPLAPAAADPANNVEMVLVNNPAPGVWTINVHAAQVNVGNKGQGYALVVRGELN